MTDDEKLNEIGKLYLDMVHQTILKYSTYLDKIEQKNSPLKLHIYNYVDEVLNLERKTKIGFEKDEITIETIDSPIEKLYIEKYNNPIKTMLLSTANFLVFFKDDEIELYTSQESLKELSENSLDSISTEEIITFKEEGNNIICTYQKNNTTTNNNIDGDKRKQIYSENEEVVFKPKRKVFKNK